MPVKSDPKTWSDPRHKWGLWGEQVAIRHLESRGWVIEAHRFRMGRLEIDIVARRGPLVAFVEVKTRRGHRFGSPLEAVTWSKRREVERVALAWIDRFGGTNDTYRFDVIGVTVERGRRTVVHVEDAFRAGWRR